MRNIINNKSGFTFIESLITFSIVGIFLSLTWATVSFLLVKTGDQIVRTRAHFFAVEGIERVKQIRQTSVNKNRENGFKTSIGSKTGNFVIKKDGNGLYALESGDNEEIIVEEAPYTTYCRTVNLDGNSTQLKKVTVDVKWGDITDCSLGEELISYSTFLAKTAQ